MDASEGQYGWAADDPRWTDDDAGGRGRLEPTPAPVPRFGRGGASPYGASPYGAPEYGSPDYGPADRGSGADTVAVPPPAWPPLPPEPAAAAWPPAPAPASAAWPPDPSVRPEPPVTRPDPTPWIPTQPPGSGREPWTSTPTPDWEPPAPRWDPPLAISAGPTSAPFAPPPMAPPPMAAPPLPPLLAPRPVDDTVQFPIPGAPRLPTLTNGYASVGSVRDTAPAAAPAPAPAGRSAGTRLDKQIHGRVRRRSDDEFRAAGRAELFSDDARYSVIFSLTALWYLPVAAFAAVWVIFVDQVEGAMVARLITTALWLGGATVLSLAVVGLLRWASVGWRALTLSVAAALIGGGVVTIAHTLSG